MFRSAVGSDTSFWMCASRRTSFDPRSRTGSDQMQKARMRNDPTFRSALPHGERPMPVPSGHLACGFDPRSRVGSDGAADNIFLGHEKERTEREGAQTMPPTAFREAAATLF